MRFFTQLVVCCLLSGSGVCFAQQPSDEPIKLDVFPPTPNAAAFQKFGDMPVTLSSGLPQIGVPIYAYKSNSGLALNVSLDYHAGGIKVEEIASDAGIGWSLNAGGMVSRTVRGLPDDHTGYGYFVMNKLRRPGEYVMDLETIYSDSVLRFYGNNIDSQSDVFNYSLNGKSGKVIYGLDGSYVNIPHSQVKVERVFYNAVANLDGFIITDTDGTKYHFMDHAPISTRMGDFLSIFQYSDAWYLSKIVSPFREDSILFEYESYTLEYTQGTYETWYVDNSNNARDFSRDVTGSNEFTGYGVRVKKIHLPDATTLDFNYDEIPRRDIDGGARLKEILVSKENAQYGYRLWHSYASASGGNGPYAPAPATVSSTRRLQLDSLQKFSSDVSEMPYRFRYIPGLPDRQSKAQDFWGYYNGRSSTTLVPAYHNIEGDRLGGADRRPDSTAVKNGALYQIQYPTGGTTTFTYEINRAGDGKLVRPIVTEQVAFGDADFVEHGYKTFTVNRTQESYPINFRFNLSDWCPQTATDCFFTFSIKNANMTENYASVHFTYEELGLEKNVVLNDFANGTYSMTWTLNHPSCSCDDMFGFTLAWNQIEMDTLQLAGGIRIKKVTDHDDMDATKNMVREYHYLKGNGMSSGSVRIVPEFTFPYTEVVYQCCTQGVYRVFTVRNSGVNYALSSIGGASVVYNQVTVKQLSDQGYTGKTVHRFTDFTDVSPPLYLGTGNLTTCLTAEPDINWGIGLPRRTTYYDKNHAIVKQVWNEYNYLEESYDEIVRFRSFKIGISGRVINHIPSGCQVTCFGSSIFSWREYAPLTGRAERTKETVVDYHQSDSTVNTTTYSYDPVFYNLKTVSRKNSRDEVEEQRLYYPHNFQVGGAIQKMAAKNMFEPVIATETWLIRGPLKQMIKGQVTDYQELSNGIVRPLRLYELEASQPVPESAIGIFNPSLVNRHPDYFKEEIVYDTFDNKGNIIQYTQKGMSSAALWDYNKGFPVASIPNATARDVAYTSFESDGKGGWTFTPHAELTASATGYRAHNLEGTPLQRTGLTASSKYMLSFWKKNATIALSTQPVAGTVSSQENAETGWTYWQAVVTGITDLTLSGEGLIDELRLYPVSAQMTTYTYTPMGNVLSTCGPDNKITTFGYDGLNRLQLVKDQNGNLVRYIEYNYKRN